MPGSPHFLSPTSSHSSTAMNILVYDGPGVSPTSLSHTVSSLKSILHSNYAIQKISPKVLAEEPWTPNCALLVIPGGRDLPYLASLAPAMKTIANYVANGGRYLGICAGAYFASGRIEWEMGTQLEVKGDRPLKFFPGLSRGCVYPGFQYESENGARTVSIQLPNETIQHGLYYNGGGEFVLEGNSDGVTPLAHYDDKERPGMIAGVLCDVKKGKAALWHVHLEYAIGNNLTRDASARVGSVLSSSDLEKAESDRLSLLRETFASLGLRFKSEPPSTPPTRPLPQLLCAADDSRGLLSEILEALKALEDTAGIIDDANDRFRLQEPGPDGSLPETSLVKDDVEIEVPDETRHIAIYKTSLPPDTSTPHFSIPAYFAALESQKARKPGAPLKCSFGNVLLYGEAVTSTQTLLERNPKLLEVLPTPLLSLATYQLSGRGRGSNVWVSPLGCLQWSLLVRPPPSFPNNKLVFVQYLVGLAVVEACRNVMGDLGKSVVLKWPNDIYAKVDVGGEQELRKIGGILVNTVFMAGGVRVIVGCGLNVLNEPPILSLSQLESRPNPRLTMENMAATIMAIFGRMWDEFVEEGSFEPFMDLYLDRWIHSDQLVTLETVSPPVKVRIVGITPEYGLLRTIPENWRNGQEPIDLRPDGNSFDMMAGLIKTKK